MSATDVELAKMSDEVYDAAGGAARWLRAMVLTLALGCISSAIAQTAASLSGPPAPPIPVEQMHTFGYTKEFAKRFALPEPEPGWEPGDGLLAVEFRVEPIAGPRGLYNCAFNLYVETKLDLAFPEAGPSGSDELYTSRLHPFLEVPKGSPGLRESDRRAYWERRRGFAQLGAFATADYVPGKRGASTSSSMRSFVRELVPGVHYVRLSSCEYARWLSKNDPTLKVWVKKSSGKDYTRIVGIDPSDFYQLALPQALITKTLPWAEWVMKHDSAVFDEESRGVSESSKR